MAASVACGFIAQNAFATATTYADTHGDQVGSTNKARDIWGAAVDDDGTNLYFTINADPGADMAHNNFNYAIGITKGPGAGGDTQADATTHGNAYGRLFSIDASQGGMLDFIGLFGEPSGGGTATNPFAGYGYNDFAYAGGTTWTAKSNVQKGVAFVKQAGGTNPSSITVAVPIADFASNFAMTAGTTLKFDIYATGTSNTQGAYDSLANASPTPGATVQYNGTGIDSYTIQGTSPLQLVWNNASGQGDGATWDTAQNNVSGGTINQNWLDGAGSASPVPFFFFQSNAVTFNDNNNGHYGVTLNTTVRPAAVTFDNSAGNYTVSGTGTIAGSGGLTKTGTSTLILATSNSYTGTTTISNGTLQLGNGGTVGSVAGPIVTNANLAINRSDTTTIASAISGTGNVTQMGNNLVTLSGSLSYQGSTNIQAGTLALTTAKTGGGAFSLSDNAALVLGRTTPDTTLSMSALTVGSSSGGATINFSLNTGGNPSVPLISTGALTLNGTNNIVVSGTNLTVGSFTLIGYTGPIAGGGTFNPSLTLPSRVLGNLSDLGSQISLQITSIDFTHWRGTANNVWTPSADNNWVLNSNNSATNYIQGDTVVFDDGAGANTTVDIESTVTPNAITVNNSNGDYTFIGGGTISGAAPLTKTGTSSLIIANSGTNDFSGTITIGAGGSVQIGAGTTSGSIGAGTMINSGALILNRSDGVRLTNSISGSGSIQINNGTSNFLGGSSSYDGTTTVASGATVTPGSANAFGSTVGATIVQDGGSIFANSASMTIAEPLTIGGAGNATSAGALHVGGGFATVFSGPVTLSSSATLQANQNATGTIGGPISGSGFDITVDGASGGGTWILTGTGNVYGRTIINAGTLSAGNGGAGGDLGSGTITDNGTLIVNRSSLVSLPNVIEGTGTVVKNGTGTLQLSGNNSFSGSVSFLNGVIQAASSTAFGTGAKTVLVDTRTKGLELAGGVTIPDSISFQTSNDGDTTQGATVTSTIHSVSGNNAINGSVTLKTGGGDTIVQVDPGSSLALNGTIQILNNAGTRAIRLNGAGVGTINGAILNGGTTGALLNVQVNGGNWTVTNPANAYLGSTHVRAGTLNVSSTGLVPGADITVSPGAAMNVSGSLTLGAVITANGSVNFAGNTGGGTIAQNISGLNVGSGTVTRLLPSAFRPIRWCWRQPA